MKRLLLQVAFMANAALSLALAFHFLAHPGFSLFGPPSAGPDLPSIGVEEVWGHIQNDSGLVVDARTADIYSYGHLPEALSAPHDLAIAPPLLDRLRSAPLVIVYCDGPNCRASHLLAVKLKDLGVQNLKIMKQGWEGWLDEGLPVELKNS